MDQYTFMLGSLITLLVYGLIYYQRPDLRRRMKNYGIFIGLWSIGSSYFLWTKDWWQPMTLTGTIVGVEDFIFGFGIGGILVSSYEFLWRKKAKETDKFSGGWHKSRKMLTIFLGAFFLTYSISGLPSWLSWSLASIAGTLTILYYRSDLVYASLGTGVFCLLYSIMVYQILLLYNPQFIQQTYLLNQLSGILVLGIPVEEFIWFFTSGCMLGPYYEFSKNLEIVDR